MAMAPHLFLDNPVLFLEPRRIVEPNYRRASVEAEHKNKYTDWSRRYRATMR